MPPKKAHVAPYHIRTFALSEANAKWVREQSNTDNVSMSSLVNDALDKERARLAKAVREALAEVEAIDG